MPKNSKTEMTSTKSKNLPATRGMLDALRTELKADNSALRNEMKAGFKEVESRFNQVESNFHRLEAKVDRIVEAVAQMQLSNEQQRDNNRITLEAISSLSEWKNHIDRKVDEVQEMVRSLVRSKKFSPESNS